MNNDNKTNKPNNKQGLSGILTAKIVLPAAAEEQVLLGLHIEPASEPSLRFLLGIKHLLCLTVKIDWWL